MVTTSTNLCFTPSMRHAGSLEGDYISVRFTQARQHAGLSLPDAADAIGCAHSLLGRIEKGSVRDTTGKGLVSQAAKVYGVNATWLFAGSCAPQRFWPEWFSA